MKTSNHKVYRLSIVLIVVLGTAIVGRPTSAQSLTLSLFERYLESLRVEAGIPGLSAAVLQNGTTLKEWGLGHQDVDATIAAGATTPYAIGELSQIFGSTLLLKTCLDEGYAELTDAVVRWAPEFPDSSATLAEVLSHTAPTGGYVYDTPRFARLTSAIDACSRQPYRSLLAEDVFRRFGMTRSMPGDTFLSPTADDQRLFDGSRLSQYAAVLRELAVPYRLVNRRPTRTDLPRRAANASTGVVTTVRDLARFSNALDDDGALLTRATREQAWRNVRAGSTTLPTGLGWFVQNYNGEPVVWQFGMVKDGYSSLMLKVPNRRLTLILLANSDGLSAPFALERGDVTASLFAKTFLTLMVP